MNPRILALLLAGLPVAPACADGLPADGKLSLSGFATFGMARTNSDEAQFVRYNQAEGVDSGVNSGTDSNLGLQASYKFTPELSATAQVLTRQYTSTHYAPELSWAFLKYQLRDELSLRAGRVVVPSFMMSDYQNVGYANTMMRPPLEMYGLAAIEHIDGADLTYQRSFGASTVTAQLAAGVSHGKLFVAGGGGSIATIRAPLYALNLALENGPFTLRLSRLTTELESRDFRMLNTLTARLRQAGFAALARELTLVGGKKISFSSVGATMDWQQLLLQGEYGRRQANEPVYIPDNDAYYVMAGYRVGALLPYYAHAAVWQKGRSVTLPANFPAGGALARRVDFGYLTAAEQHSDLLGLRWNFAKARALKVQIDRLRPTRKSGGLINGPADGLKHPVVVVAFALDAVF
ncbi:porin [Janthinobacterium sp. CG3]|uniref:porin n=1 Tax=Janthinobacterium sp. CG3 TaxID=1075768 RepID=UPI000345884C|nr:porin [Janthinobacterium sp. CG3]